jgi:DNA-binding CsgD family transcriptional regulator
MAIKRNLKPQILTLRNQGKSYREIQKELSCSKGTINYHCKENELTDIGMKVAPVNLEIKNSIANFCKENTLIEASKHFGLSLSTIKKYKKFQE